MGGAGSLPPEGWEGIGLSMAAGGQGREEGRARNRTSSNTPVLMGINNNPALWGRV